MLTSSLHVTLRPAEQVPPGLLVLGWLAWHYPYAWRNGGEPGVPTRRVRGEAPNDGSKKVPPNQRMKLAARAHPLF